MSDQEVTYSTVRMLQPPSQSQNRLRPRGTEIARKTDEKESSVCWPRIAVILGIFCLFLLMAIIVLGTKIFQYIQEKHHQEEILRNLSQKYDILQNDSYSVRQLLTNMTSECGILKMKLDGKTLWAYYTEKMECCRKKEIFSKSLQNTGKLKKGDWCCWGIKCYYFTIETGAWKGCKQICQSYSSSLLKIDNAEELTFLQSQMSQNSYWIGASFNKEESKWKWIDGDTCGFNLKVMNIPSGIGQCVFLTRTRASSIVCSEIYHCICEKRIDCFNKH